MKLMEPLKEAERRENGQTCENRIEQRSTHFFCEGQYGLSRHSTLPYSVKTITGNVNECGGSWILPTVCETWHRGFKKCISSNQSGNTSKEEQLLKFTLRQLGGRAGGGGRVLPSTQILPGLALGSPLHQTG